MSEKKTLLKLTEPVGGQIIIDEKAYDTVHPDVLSTDERLQLNRIAKKGERIKKLAGATEETPELAAAANEFDAQVDAVIERILVAPEAVRKALPNAFKQQIIMAVFTQGAGSPSKSETSSEPSLASSVSTGAIN